MNALQGNDGSQPDLSNLDTTDLETQNISMRKRKVPDDNFEIQFKEFKREILALIKDFGRSQAENTSMIRKDISLIKEQITDIKNTTDLLIAENNNFKAQIEDLKSSVNDTQEKVKVLENGLHMIQSKQLKISSLEHATSLTYDNIMSEVHERTERSKNIIITGIPEAHMNSMEKKRELDRSEVKKLLLIIRPDCPEPIKILRLGKYDGKKTRPLKVCFSSSETSKAILKSKMNLTDPNIKIYSDQTPIQRQTMLNLREEMRHRTENGENNLIIKYIKGNPKIIQQQPKN
ncbi:unnamed protein product [Euphydryas editha]|uniref:L1 transposable element RRM domain-containing protein n=1 Tax=Euphydryas editha TaxID=104508 RepID=A0AAU9UN35_EUPED|nr:unnamed protein product [Euphydryas editha]